jgi:hypothetical protein
VLLDGSYSLNGSSSLPFPWELEPGVKGQQASGPGVLMHLQGRLPGLTSEAWIPFLSCYLPASLLLSSGLFLV